MPITGSKFTITTRGVKGASMLSREFFTNIDKVISKAPLDEYAGNVVSDMMSDAPVQTGYLRSNIRTNRVDATTVAVTAWAPYSGWAEYRSSRPYYFSNNTFQSASNGGMVLGDASMKYLRILINKYQNGP